MKNDTARLNYLWAQLIVEEFYRIGIRHFCLGSGARCTPLTVAIAGHDKIVDTVHFDERSMGYFAIGAVKNDSTPTVIVTTSGTAVANLLPAIVEAAMDHIPIIIISADRPPELRKCGANQTIDQVNIFDAVAGVSVYNFRFAPQDLVLMSDSNEVGSCPVSYVFDQTSR